MHGMKCHDHHALLQDILPIAIGGFLTKEVTEPIIELEKFFKNLCSKCLTIEDLDILEAEIITTLYELEIIFPPAFFDAMIHLPIHLAREAKLGRPVQYQWMYPIERQTNCTSEGIVLPHDEFKKACLHVLQNCEEVSPFMEEYTREIERKVLVGDEMHNNDFLDWFRARIFVLSAQGQANDELKSLAVGPYPLVHRYSTYMVNGFRFHRKELNIPDDIDRAVGSGARDIVNYCGLIMRSTVSFREGDWKENVLKYGEAMWLKVKDKFEATSGVRQHVLQGFVISTMQRLFRAWKARLSTHYSRYNTDAERLSHRPEDVELEDWKYLIEYFGSEDFKAVSERNKKNREKQVTRHSCGTKSFAEVEESTRNDVTGEKEPPDKVWEIQHTRKNDNGELIWSDPFSKQVHEQLEELVVQQQSAEIEHPMTRDEILTSVLGERPGYVRGKGYGKKPPKKSRLEQANLEASVSSAMELVRQEMQAEMDRKLLEEREQMTAELKRNMEEELQKKLEDEREHVTLEVTKTIQLEVDKKIQEQFASFLRMQQDQCS